MIPVSDRDILRRLAADIAALAQQPIQHERIAGWTKVNDMKSHRPMLWITEIPWREFAHKVDELKLGCVEPECRDVEFQFRKDLFMARHLPCDAVVLGEYRVYNRFVGLNFGVEVKERLIGQGGADIQSHGFESIISGMEDLEKIKIPRVSVDTVATRRMADFANALFGDILPVKTVGIQQNFYAAWDDVVRWTGVTEALMALVENPDFIHALMRRVTDVCLSWMDQFEEKKLLDRPYPLDRVGSGGAGYTSELPRNGKTLETLTAMDLWGGSTSQIFSEVSPDMHDEFALKYEMEIMERCGLNYYGCCEPLHNKMHLLAKVPRLRKISISPWCDTAKAAQNAGRLYVFSHKPSPAIFAGDAFSVEEAEKELRRRLDQSRGQGIPCEVIMKDISTVRGDVRRLIDWAKMADRVVREYDA